MNRNASYYLKSILLGIFILIIFVYSFFQTRNLILGPSINIESPTNGSTYNTPLVEIKGIAKNINYLTLDDRTIFTDNLGNFDEKMLLSPGYNVIKLEARDKFGKHTNKIIEIILKEATSTDVTVSGSDIIEKASSTPNQ